MMDVRCNEINEKVHVHRQEREEEKKGAKKETPRAKERKKEREKERERENRTLSHNSVVLFFWNRMDRKKSVARY